MKNERDPEMTQVFQYLTLRLAGEEYAVPITGIREIIRFEYATRVPKAPPWIVGIINMRGLVVPVVDLAIKMGLPARPSTRFSCVVLAELEMDGETVSMGVLADSVSQVLDLSAADIEAPPSFGTNVRLEYLRGMARSATGGIVLLIDLNGLLVAGEILPYTKAVEVTEAGLVDAAGEGAPSASEGSSPDQP